MKSAGSAQGRASPGRAATLNKYSVTYVYFGERKIWDGQRHITLAQLRDSPSFTEVFTDGAAHVFKINLPQQTMLCTKNLVAGVVW